MSGQSMETLSLVAMLQMKQLEVATLKVANKTLRERIQWLEYLVDELREQGEGEEEEVPKQMGFHSLRG